MRQWLIGWRRRNAVLVICLMLGLMAPLALAAVTADIDNGAGAVAGNECLACLGPQVSPVDETAHGFWVAADPGLGRYLLVYLGGAPGRDDVIARLIDADGRLLGAPLKLDQSISVMTGFDPDSQRYLVVYFTNQQRVWGHLLDRDGRSVGPSFPIASFGTTFSDSLWYPTVAAAPGHNRFLVAWPDQPSRGRQAIASAYMRMVSAAGTGGTLSPARRISVSRTVPTVTGGRTMIYDRRHERFLVVITRWGKRIAGRQGLWYAKVAVDGSLLDWPRPLARAGVQPSLAVDEEGGRLLVAWESMDDRDPRFRLYDLDFQPLGPEYALPGWERGVDNPTAAFDPVTRRYLITWRNDYNTSFFGQYVNEDGIPIGRPFVVVDLRDFSVLPLSFPRPGGGFLVFYEDRYEEGVIDPDHKIFIRFRELLPGEQQKPADISVHPSWKGPPRLVAEPVPDDRGKPISWRSGHSE